MSEYPSGSKPKKHTVTVQKLDLKLLPDKIRKHIQNVSQKKEKHVGLLQTVNHSGLQSIMDTAYAFFESPLTTSGFEQAGAHAIGLVIQPRARGTVDNLVRALTNSSTVLNAWGHTALYVRVDGKIQRVIGFDPFKISTDVILRGKDVTEGRRPTPGHYNDDSGLFQNNSARSIEYPVDRELAIHILESMPHHGPANKYPQLMKNYIGSPGKYLKGSEELQFVTGNCISYAMNAIKELGVDVYGINTGGKTADTAIVDLGGKLMSNQGTLSRNLVYLEKEHKKTLVLRWTVDNNTYELAPTLGAMPKSFVVIKGLTHVYLLSSVARFTAPMIVSMLPTPLYQMVPAAPWILQSGVMARNDTFSALSSAFDTLADQYISKEALRYLHQIALLIGTAYIIYGGEDMTVEIVYGALSAVLPYIMDWLAQGVHQATGL